VASGKKNYFRHSFFTHNDIKMLMLKDSIGIGFYFYYFSLLELCGEESSDHLLSSYVFHDATIRSLWSVNLKKSEHIATQMNAVGLLEFKKGNKNFQFTIPNFSKYLGKYTNKTEPNGPNKRKEKERKEKERKENSAKALTPDDVVQLWNEKMPSNNFKHCLGLGSGRHVENFLEARQWMQDLKSWDELFTKCVNNKKLNGENEIKWRVNLTWLVDYDNALKVLNGNYENEKTWMDTWAKEQ